MRRRATRVLRWAAGLILLGTGATSLGAQGAAPLATIGETLDNLMQSTVFLRLGIEHILTGIDHLLFVLGLLLIVRGRWMLLKTITAFTVAHSITLAIATLGWASAPTLPLNA